MKKIVLTFGLILLSFAVFAQGTGKQRVFDQANLFSESQTATLEENLAEFLDRYNMEAVIVTTSDTHGKSAEAYADDFYDENGFGTGSGKDGVLFLIDMDNRKIHVSTSGSMIDYLEDWRIEKIYDDVSP
ncbi:MAG: TPM domain-containing protein, partial [Spirochaetaceae bacterium]|nr:TPM domain-containing protein [Spirochaetaceae bacterium]